MKWVCLCVFPLVFHSCGFIHYMGTKEPADESPELAALFLKKHRYTFADHTFFLQDSLVDSLSSPLHALDTWKLNKGTPQSLMQIRIYDSSGKFVNGYAQCYGPYKRLNILKKKEFKYFRQFPNNQELQFSDEFALWNLSPSEKTRIEEVCSKNAYTFVIYWNCWSNHYSKVMLQAVKKYLKNYETPDFQIQVVLVNTGVKPKNSETSN
ncbi:hypothetical protein D3C71_1142920 [compost metagenome]